MPISNPCLHAAPPPWMTAGQQKRAACSARDSHRRDDFRPPPSALLAGKTMSSPSVELYGEKDQTYDLNFKEENNHGSQKVSGDSSKNVYKSFVDEYPIFPIEDLFDQDDWVHYAKMIEEIGEQRAAKAIAEKSCDALLLKVNHSVPVTDSIEAVTENINTGRLWCNDQSPEGCTTSCQEITSCLTV
ncbi:hypothetical protein QYE76_016852 [Lolium multiflorum]|uniref:phosphopyruvate hydratase n=1 Tax=Lolium multiflorum TaxID=4521 RepID=A0AAD8QFJ9_LOLMU|nr:hypothetical protein QYE76_016852 [Lolium multiflorum]